MWQSDTIPGATLRVRIEREVFALRMDPTLGVDTKASYGSDVRRLVFDPALRFAGLGQELKTHLDESMKVRFRDNKGELCMIMSDEEVRVPSQLRPR